MVSQDHSSDRFPMLVVCDAGAAGRDLLVRRDLELAWALTHDEAEAYLRTHRPGLVLVREAMAAETLARAKASKNGAPVMVLLEPDGWANRTAYLEMGAAVLAQSSGRARILEAVSELTGRPFPSHVRVPFASFVEVVTQEDRVMAETIDMSRTGMGVRHAPILRVGCSVTVHLDNLEPTLDLPAVVIRSDGEAAGLRFLDLEPDVAQRLQDLVDVQTARFPPPEMPEGLTVDIGGTFTMELLDAGTSDLGNDMRFRDMLHEAVVEGVTSREGWPRWLVNLEKKLTDYERRCFDEDPAACHASAAIDLRITLARTRTEEPYTFPTRALAQRVLDFSRLLQDHDGFSRDELADITIVRGQLLRAVYGDLSKRNDHDPARRAA